MPIPRTSRRSFLELAAMSTVGGIGLAACGSSGPAQPGGSASQSGGGAGGGGAATMWALSGQPNQGIQTKSIEAFNKLGKGKLSVDYFQADAYKTKIRTAIGANQAPTMIYGWGGGILKSYADAGQVEDLTAWLGENAAFKDKFVPATWGSATFDGKIFAVPTNNTQPIVLYFNKMVFDKAGAQPPKTWDDVMALVEKFNGQGIAPFSLAGQSKWTSMMWLEYLFDRIGGPDVFNAIFANKANAWSDPAVITSCQRVQELVKAKGFIKGFSSITADSSADQALLYTGKAAMLLHGGWAYGGMKAANPAFVKSSLGFTRFPSVAGGKGDVKNAVGNPANYWAISAKASEDEQKVAKAYLTDGMFSSTDVDAYIASGGVPVVTSAKPKIASSDSADFLNFVYTLTSEAPHFQQSWDQALSPVQADALLTNIDKLFLIQMTPKEFATKMNATIGK